MLAAMQISWQNAQPITNLNELQDRLLQMIPLENREDFFLPPAPANLSEQQLGLAENNLGLAKDRVEKAIHDQEKVLIFGDYDCDGVTATAILWETLRQRGLLAQPFLPHRERHGFGLSVKALEELWQQYQPSLVITVDNGIVAHQAVDWLKERRVSVLLTDHHEATEKLPAADLILHSTKLCGATVSWTLANSLAPEFAEQQLDLAAIGTIADQVPLYGANRSFAWHGLKALQTTKRPSLLALAEVAGLNLASATSTTIHFGLAPRINAMGRLYDAMDALRALVSRRPDKVIPAMQRLQQTNLERQSLTQAALQEVLATLSQHRDESVAVIAGQFPEGIIGLIASKLVDQTHKPAIVLSLGENLAKASCRSVPGFAITDWLRQVNLPYLSLGGHAMAAGFSIPADQVENSMAELRADAKTKVSPSLLEKRISITGEISGNLLNRETALTIQRFAPFGAGNEEPLFLLRAAKIINLRPVGREQKHAQLTLSYQGSEHQAICFGYQDKNLVRDTNVDLMVRLQPSSYRNRPLEIQVQHILAADAGELEPLQPAF